MNRAATKLAVLDVLFNLTAVSDSSQVNYCLYVFYHKATKLIEPYGTLFRRFNLRIFAAVLEVSQVRKNGYLQATYRYKLIRVGIRGKISIGSQTFVQIFF